MNGPHGQATGKAFEISQSAHRPPLSPGRSENEASQVRQNWPAFLKGVSLFDNAIRLRNLIWTLQRHFPTGTELLEVGFGSGTTALLLSDLGYRVTACDIDPELVSRFASGYADWIVKGRLAVQKADMFDFPWPAKSFALAYHQGVLEHFADEEIVAALREQGRIAQFVLFDVPNHRYKARPFGDERLLPIRHWRKLIRNAGLDLVDERGRGFSHGLYCLPHALFCHRALDAMPWFAQKFAMSSIFLCRSQS